MLTQRKLTKRLSASLMCSFTSFWSSSLLQYWDSMSGRYSYHSTHSFWDFRSYSVLQRRIILRVCFSYLFEDLTSKFECSARESRNPYPAFNTYKITCFVYNSIGDRIATSSANRDTDPNGSSTWYVEKVTLFTTTVRFATTNVSNF